MPRFNIQRQQRASTPRNVSRGRGASDEVRGAASSDGKGEAQSVTISTSTISFGPPAKSTPPVETISLGQPAQTVRSTSEEAMALPEPDKIVLDHFLTLPFDVTSPTRDVERTRSAFFDVMNHVGEVYARLTIPKVALLSVEALREIRQFCDSPTVQNPTNWVRRLLAASRLKNVSMLERLSSIDEVFSPWKISSAAFTALNVVRAQKPIRASTSPSILIDDLIGQRFSFDQEMRDALEKETYVDEEEIRSIRNLLDASATIRGKVSSVFFVLSEFQNARTMLELAVTAGGSNFEEIRMKFAALTLVATQLPIVDWNSMKNVMTTDGRTIPSISQRVVAYENTILDAIFWAQIYRSIFNDVEIEEVPSIVKTILAVAKANPDDVKSCFKTSSLRTGDCRGNLVAPLEPSAYGDGFGVAFFEEMVQKLRSVPGEPAQVIAHLIPAKCVSIAFQAIKQALGTIDQIALETPRSWNSFQVPDSRTLSSSTTYVLSPSYFAIEDAAKAWSSSLHVCCDGGCYQNSEDVIEENAYDLAMLAIERYGVLNPLTMRIVATRYASDVSDFPIEGLLSVLKLHHIEKVLLIGGSTLAGPIAAIKAGCAKIGFCPRNAEMELIPIFQETLASMLGAGQRLQVIGSSMIPSIIGDGFDAVVNLASERVNDSWAAYHLAEAVEQIPIFINCDTETDSLRELARKMAGRVGVDYTFSSSADVQAKKTIATVFSASTERSDSRGEVWLRTVGVGTTTECVQIIGVAEHLVAHGLLSNETLGSVLSSIPKRDKIEEVMKDFPTISPNWTKLQEEWKKLKALTPGPERLIVRGFFKEDDHSKKATTDLTIPVKSLSEATAIFTMIKQLTSKIRNAFEKSCSRGIKVAGQLWDFMARIKKLFGEIRLLTIPPNVLNAAVEWRGEIEERKSLLDEAFSMVRVRQEILQIILQSSRAKTSELGLPDEFPVKTGGGRDTTFTPQTGVMSIRGYLAASSYGLIIPTRDLHGIVKGTAQQFILRNGVLPKIFTSFDHQSTWELVKKYVPTTYATTYAEARRQALAAVDSL